MKKQILASLILTSLSLSAFALPQSTPLPLSGGVNAGSTLAADGAERTGVNRFAADGAERTGVKRIAADGAERTGVNRIG